jgi:hypothetical protein
LDTLSTSSCSPQIVNVDENARLQGIFNDVIPSINMISIHCSVSGRGPTDAWLKYCGTVGKPGGKRRIQISTSSIAITWSARLKKILAQGASMKINEEPIR